MRKTGINSLLVILLLLTITPSQAMQPTAVKSMTVAKLVSKLKVKTEMRTGYQRSLFKHWIDADSDGCDTRAEVLISEATSKPSIGGGCSISGGVWLSSYDGVKVTVSSKLDIDHMVPLAEAWDSGAYGWSSAQRQAYANDLGDPRALIAVTASSNRSKSDKDPAEWLPKLNVCTYIANWVAVKYRWNLAIDLREKAAITAKLVNCKKSNVKVSRVAGIPAPGTVSSSTPDPTTTSGGEVYYANCDAVRAAGKAPLHRGDPGYRSGLDRDGDGVACE